MTSSGARVAVVLAAWNEAGSARELADRLATVLERAYPGAWEVVAVVAGDDGTFEAFAGREHFRLLREGEPRGLAAAFRSGFAAVSPEARVIVTLDADLNHQPEEIPRLVAALEGRRADIVVGSRSVPGAAVRDSPLWKRWLSRSGNRAIRWLFGDQVRDRSSGFRVYRAAALGRLPVEGSGFAFLPAMLLAAERLGLQVVEEPITFVHRRWGRSKLPLVATTIGYLRLALGRARAPAREERA
jgi:dolichol-phosphate mannosyltransferase